jgi:hypothetical protein
MSVRTPMRIRSTADPSLAAVLFTVSCLGNQTPVLTIQDFVLSTERVRRLHVRSFLAHNYGGRWNQATPLRVYDFQEVDGVREVRWFDKGVLRLNGIPDEITTEALMKTNMTKYLRPSICGHCSV